MDEAVDFDSLARSFTGTTRVLGELTNFHRTGSQELLKLRNVPRIEEHADIRVEIRRLRQEILVELRRVRQEIVQQIAVSSDKLSQEIVHSSEKLIKLGAARDRNVYAMLDNENAKQLVSPVTPLYSINLEEAEQLNMPIPNFLITVRALKNLTGNRCRLILAALNVPIQHEEDQ